MSKIENYLMTIKLTNFLDARIIESEDSEGNIEEGVFIPLAKNGLRRSKRNEVYFNAFINEKTWDTADGSTHYVKQMTNEAHVKKLDSLGYSTPYLGTLRPSKYRTRSQIFDVRCSERRVKIQK